MAREVISRSSASVRALCWRDQTSGTYLLGPLLGCLFCCQGFCSRSLGLQSLYLLL